MYEEGRARGITRRLGEMSCKYMSDEIGVESLGAVGNFLRKCFTITVLATAPNSASHFVCRQNAPAGRKLERETARAPSALRPARQVGQTQLSSCEAPLQKTTLSVVVFVIHSALFTSLVM
jgi:hypothetical protein